MALSRQGSDSPARQALKNHRRPLAGAHISTQKRNWNYFCIISGRAAARGLFLRVLFVTTEMDDFVRVGGLAAVSAALPRALRLWSDVPLLPPGYRDLLQRFTHIQIFCRAPPFADTPACWLRL